MPEKKPKVAASRKLGKWIIAFVSVIGVAATFCFFIPGQEEHVELLFEKDVTGKTVSLPSDRGFSVQGGNIYWLDFTVRSNEGNTWVFYQMPLHGGKPRLLYKDTTALIPIVSPEEIVVLLPPDRQIQRDPTFFREEEKLHRYVGDDGRRGWVGPTYLYNKKTAPGEQRETVARPVRRQQPSPQLMRIALTENGDKSTVTKSSIDLQGYNLFDNPYVFTAKGLYWVRPDTPTVDRVFPTKKGVSPRLEMRAEDTLMFTPFGEKPREMRKGCLLLGGDLNGVLSEIGPYPQTVVTSYELSPDGTSPPVRQPILNKNGGAVDDREFGAIMTGHRCLRCGDRFYWFQGETTGTPYLVEEGNTVIEKQETRRVIVGLPYASGPYSFDETISVKLMSSALDGSDERFVAELHDHNGRNVQPKYLLSDKGKLYLLYTMGETPSSSNKNKIQTVYLAALHPEMRDKALGKPLSLGAREIVLCSQRAFEGYLYFKTATTQSSPLDFLSANATDRRVDSFWRIRLPE